MPLTIYALEKFVAQDISQLTECIAVPVASEFPDSSSWLKFFVLNSIFKITLPNDRAAFAFAIIRRAEGAIEDYETAREALVRIAAGDKSISVYFRCLRHFESSIASLYQALDFIRKALKINLFDQGDDSPEERLNLLYNRSKHAAPEKLPEGQLHAIWIRKTGLFTDGASLTFDELRNLICFISGIADMFAKGEYPNQPSSSPDP